MGKVIVVGSSNTDMVVRGKKIPVPGETVMGSSFEVIAGGKGANQAVAVARAGAQTTFVAKVGADEFGENAINGYSTENINVKHVTKEESLPSGIAVITIDDRTGENAIVVAPGANSKLSAQDVKNAEDEIKDADILLVQLEIPLETVECALKLARKYNVITILNPAPGRKLDSGLLKLVDIITPNETEAEILTGIHINSVPRIEEAASQLLEYVGKAVVITLGSDGAYLLNKEDKGRIIPAIKVKAIDTVAAGDVFNGYIAASMANGLSLEESIKVANSAAAISVTRNGAQPSVPFLNEL